MESSEASSASAGFVSTSTVGGTTVATTKSLSVIVGLTPSGSSILLILIESPISLLIRSNCNLSGQPIQEIVNFYKIDKKKIYVIHDDLDLELGKVKLKFGGGNGGHNGLSNIDEMIGNNYNRIRIGINHPGSKDLVSSYVLNKFTNDEMNIIEKKLDKFTNNFNILLDDQVLFLTKLAEDN